MNSNNTTPTGQQIISSTSSSVRDRELFTSNLHITTPTVTQLSSSVPNDYYFEKRSLSSQNNNVNNNSNTTLVATTPCVTPKGGGGGGVEFLSNAEVFISDCPLINQVVFEKWLQGASIEQTSNFLFEKQRSSRSELFSKFSYFIDNYFKLIINEVTYQYRIFTDFQPYLQNPSLFMSCNTILQVAPTVKKSLIQQYFDFDERVYRELMGKKLTSKLRRDLEEISERCSIEIISVRRQFDNLKTIFKFIKASASCTLNEFLLSLHKHDSGQSIISKIIQEKFMLSEKLSEKYATLVFLIYQRFELNKKVMKDYKFQDVYFLCSQIFKHWTYHAKGKTKAPMMNNNSTTTATTNNNITTTNGTTTTSGTNNNSSSSNMIIPSSASVQQQESTSPITITTSMGLSNISEEEQVTVFDSHQIAIDFMKFRDIKSLIFSDKIRLKEYITSIKKELADDKAFTDDVLERIDEIIISSLKSLLQIGQGLTKEMRDIFTDLYDKFIEPIEEINLTGHQLFQLLEAARESFLKISTAKPQHIQKYYPTFSLYMMVIRDIVVYMYKKLH